MVSLLYSVSACDLRAVRIFLYDDVSLYFGYIFEQCAANGESQISKNRISRVALKTMW